MEYHNYVTRSWPRCSQVELQGEDLICKVDRQRSYDFTDERPQLPVRFMNLKTDDELKAFVTTWGPLWLGPEESFVRSPRAAYWAFQVKLRAETMLLRSLQCGDKASLQTALVNYIQAEDAFWGISHEGVGLTKSLASLAVFGMGSPVDIKDRIPKAALSELREWAAIFVGFYSVTYAPHVTWNRWKIQITWIPSLISLADAIEWGLWKSLTGTRAITACEECGTFFLPESAHRMKFCTYKCAHRVAVRMWRKHREEKSGTNGRKHAKAKKA
jgi:Family of unknown function (DUF6076)